MIVLVIAAFIIGFLVGAKQEQKRLKPKEYIPEPEVVQQLQKLAGIIKHDSEKGAIELQKILSGLEQKKDAAIANFKSVVIDGNELKHAMLNAKEILDKSIQSTERSNKIRKEWEQSKKKSKGGASKGIEKIEIPAPNEPIPDNLLNK